MPASFQSSNKGCHFISIERKSKKFLGTIQRKESLVLIAIDGNSVVQWQRFISILSAEIKYTVNIQLFVLGEPKKVPAFENS